MSDERILVVDDDEDILELLSYDLGKLGYVVTCVNSGRAAAEATQVAVPDLIVLDVMLPEISGLELCRLLKKDPRTSDVPILMLSAKGAEDDVVAGLEAGADDYVSKPFSSKVLGTRIRALLRDETGALPNDAQPINIGDLALNPATKEAIANGVAIQLTRLEFRLLRLLASKPGWAFTRAQIAEVVQGEVNVVSDRTVDVQLSGVRRKLGDLGRLIETVRGVGYRFKG